MSFFPAGQGFLAGLAGTVNGNLTVTGQVLAGDGTAVAPGIAFASQPNTGIRKSASGQVELVGNGTDSAFATQFGLQARTPFVAAAGLRVIPPTVQTINYTSLQSDRTIIMNGVSLTLTLIAAPATGTEYLIRNQAATSLTVARNGQNINLAAADLAVLTGTTVMIVFITGSGWFVVG